MIPRIHRRGTSFKAACAYILHDRGKVTSDRVAWSMTQHLYGHLDDCWYEMFDTYRNRAVLKANAGVAARGRDNKTPVLHYTLSWHASDNPEPEHMRAMALASLKALGLSEHQAVMTAHADKEHHHVHVVANTVHPYTGRTAALKFTKLEFSKWAEAYEREHGIHCAQRIENNERRRKLAKERERDHALHDLAKEAGQMPLAPKAYEPVKDRSPNRRQWFERKEITDRMKALRAALDHEQKIKREETWAKHVKERNALDAETKAVIDKAAQFMRAVLKPQWKQLYTSHKREDRFVRKVATHPLERAIYIFRNRTRLSLTGHPLTIRQMVPLILSSKKLEARKTQIQERERRQLARLEKSRTKQLIAGIWTEHCHKFDALCERQSIKHIIETSRQVAEKKEITFPQAKADLIREQDQVRLEQARKSPSALLVSDQELQKGVPRVPQRSDSRDEQHAQMVRPPSGRGASTEFEHAARHVRRHDKQGQELSSDTKRLADLQRRRKTRDFGYER